MTYIDDTVTFLEYITAMDKTLMQARHDKISKKDSEAKDTKKSVASGTHKK